MPQGKVNDIGRPDLVRAVDHQAAQEARVDLVFGVRPVGIRFRPDGPLPQLAHRVANPLSTHHDSCALEQVELFLRFGLGPAYTLLHEICEK